MIKSLDLISDMVRAPRPMFRQSADRPKKSGKRRYERRKIREMIRLGDWQAEALA